MTTPSQTLTAPAVAPPTTDLFELLCARRGWTTEFLQAVNSPDHDALMDIDTMVDVLAEAHRNGTPITIAPDFDMDGIASGVLGYAGLAEMGFAVSLHLPDYTRGHDLTEADIDEIAERFPATQILLTCDSAVNSHAGIRAAKNRGWTTLVTDHHQELEPGSNADVTVNPCRIDETYALRGICGAHVLHQVLARYAERFQPQKTWEIRLLRLFAGLGTVSDVMPLLFENREMVKDSLSIARLLHVPAPRPEGRPFGPPETDKIDIDKSILLTLLQSAEHHPAFLAAFEGFALLLKAFAQAGKLRDAGDLDEGFYGFYVAPAMNSPRRTGAPLVDCFDAFTLTDRDEKLAALHRVLENNERRKDLVAERAEKIRTEDQPYAPWVYFSDAYTGMLGLLANQMMEQNGVPCAVLPRPTAPDRPISGSGRAPEWFSIIDTLDEFGNPDIFAVGHQQACGVKLNRADMIDELAAAFRDATERTLSNTETVISPRGDLVLGERSDCDASLTEVERLIELVTQVDMLRPFGHGFTEPVFEIAIDLAGLRVDRIGSQTNCVHENTEEHGHLNERGFWVCMSCKRHLRLVTRTGLACLWWNAVEDNYERMIELTRDVPQDSTAHLRVLAKLQTNEFMGETRVQAVIDRELDVVAHEGRP